MKVYSCFAMGLFVLVSCSGETESGDEQPISTGGSGANDPEGAGGTADEMASGGSGWDGISTATCDDPFDDDGNFAGDDSSGTIGDVFETSRCFTPEEWEGRWTAVGQGGSGGETESCPPSSLMHERPTVPGYCGNELIELCEVIAVEEDGSCCYRGFYQYFYGECG